MVMDVLIDFIVGIILQYVCVSNHPVVHIKYNLFVNYNSIKPKIKLLFL